MRMKLLAAKFPSSLLVSQVRLYLNQSINNQLLTTYGEPFTSYALEMAGYYTVTQL